MRSALSYGEETNWNDVYPFEKASVDELYEKRLGYDYNKTITDLKWSDNADNKNQVKVYIESLMYLIRNKVVIGNGRLEKTKIRWFYPVSMERGRYNNLKNAWEKAYEIYFGGSKENIIPITESIAPFEYYMRDHDANSLVTIDIGGGTTDIVISANGSEKVDFITSFRFAANALFGDGYAENSRTKNGIVRQFVTAIKEELKTKINENDDLFRIFDEVYENKSSADMASFLFSLRYNKKIRQTGENLAENVNLERKLLDDETQKITFIFFYSAIVYHLALLMKAQDLQMPDKIVFSGNGSKVLPFFTDDTDILRDYTRLIFEKVYGNTSLGNLEIIRQKNPKEATCKGGFFVDHSETFGDIYKKRVVLHANGSNTVIEQSGNRGTYATVDKAYLNSTAEEAIKFVQFIFDLLPSFSTWGYKLNSSSIEIAKQVCFNKNRLDIHTRSGWKMKQQEVEKTEVIEETLFFYPLIGLLKDLSDTICDKNIRKS
jgi:ribosomal protein L25 (general stress protein Ctc)